MEIDQKQSALSFDCECDEKTKEVADILLELKELIILHYQGCCLDGLINWTVRRKRSALPPPPPPPHKKSKVMKKSGSRKHGLASESTSHETLTHCSHPSSSSPSTDHHLHNSTILISMPFNNINNTHNWSQQEPTQDLILESSTTTTSTDPQAIIRAHDHDYRPNLLPDLNFPPPEHDL